MNQNIRDIIINQLLKTNESIDFNDDNNDDIIVNTTSIIIENVICYLHDAEITDMIFCVETRNYTHRYLFAVKNDYIEMFVNRFRKEIDNRTIICIGMVMSNCNNNIHIVEMFDITRKTRNVTTGAEYFGFTIDEILASGFNLMDFFEYKTYTGFWKLFDNKILKEYANIYDSYKVCREDIMKYDSVDNIPIWCVYKKRHYFIFTPENDIIDNYGISKLININDNFNEDTYARIFQYMDITYSNIENFKIDGADYFIDTFINKNMNESIDFDEDDDNDTIFNADIRQLAICPLLEAEPGDMVFRIRDTHDQLIAVKLDYIKQFVNIYNNDININRTMNCIGMVMANDNDKINIVEMFDISKKTQNVSRSAKYLGWNNNYITNTANAGSCVWQCKEYRAFNRFWEMFNMHTLNILSNIYDTYTDVRENVMKYDSIIDIPFWILYDGDYQLSIYEPEPDEFSEGYINDQFDDHMDYARFFMQLEIPYNAIKNLDIDGMQYFINGYSSINESIDFSDDSDDDIINSDNIKEMFDAVSFEDEEQAIFGDVILYSNEYNSIKIFHIEDINIAAGYLQNYNEEHYKLHGIVIDETALLILAAMRPGHFNTDAMDNTNPLVSYYRAAHSSFMKYYLITPEIMSIILKNYDTFIENIKKINDVFGIEHVIFDDYWCYASYDLNGEQFDYPVPSVATLHDRNITKSAAYDSIRHHTLYITKYHML